MEYFGNHMVDMFLGDEPWNEKEGDVQIDKPKCSLCNDDALSCIKVVGLGNVKDDGEYFCDKHTQEVVDQYPKCYDEDEWLRIEFDV